MLQSKLLPNIKQSSQNGFVIWHGMRIAELCELLRMNPALHWTRWNRLALLPPMAVYNSLMGAIENWRFGKAVQQTELAGPPVFVLGFWRSGTTLLHNLLSKDPQFTSPTMYRTLFPWHFLTTEKVVSKATRWLIPRSRPMDNVPMSWDATQEDDIALCIMSLVSCYMFMATPEDFTQYWRSLDFRKLSESERQRWKECLLLLLKKISFRDKRRIVLKSPSHTFRIPTLLEMFPDAQFVYIYRNPYDVFRSAVHLRKTVIQENGLGRPVFKDVEKEILKSYQLGFEAYERDRMLIPEGNLTEVRFEDLETDPMQEMSRVYQNLSLPGFETVQEILKREELHLKRYKKNRFQHDAEQMAEVYDTLRPAFDRFGYPAPEDEQASHAAA